MHVAHTRISSHHAPGWEFVSVTIHSCAGMVSTRFTWNPFMKRVKDKYNVLALDQRGWGESPLGYEDEYTAETVAADIEYTLQEDFGDQKVVLMGHSMGGKVVMKFAADYPDRCLCVCRLVIGRLQVEYR